MRVVEICIVPEEEGGFSAFVPTLPGVGSQGDEYLDAFRNCEEALHSAIAAYQDEGRPIPWKNDPWKDDPAPQDPSIRSAWVQVDVERVA